MITQAKLYALITMLSQFYRTAYGVTETEAFKTGLPKTFQSRYHKMLSLVKGLVNDLLELKGDTQ